MNQYIAKLLDEKPAKIIGTLAGLFLGAGSFLTTVQGPLDGVSGWGQASVIIFAAVWPFIQGWTTHNKTITPAQSRTLAKQARFEGSRRVEQENADRRSEAARKGIATRRAQVAKTTAKPTRKVKK